MLSVWSLHLGGAEANTMLYVASQAFTSSDMADCTVSSQAPGFSIADSHPLQMPAHIPHGRAPFQEMIAEGRHRDLLCGPKTNRGDVE